MARAVVGTQPFHEAFTNLMERYGYVDWAVVVRKVDSDMDAFWEAGTGKSVVGDRERADVLYAEIGRLQATIIAATTPKQVDSPEA